MRQVAWLHAAPKEDKKGKLSGEVEPESRLKTLKDEGRPVPLPDNPAPYITDWLFEIGPTISNGMGRARLEWRDIAAWCEVLGAEIEPWEARLIRRLSGDYAEQLHLAEKPDCPPPWISESEQNRRAVADKVSAILGGRARKE